VIDVKKATSVVFQMNLNNLDDKGPGKSNRYLALYKKLQRNRQLAQFCRDAFIEKAGRQLGGLEYSYLQLDSLIKSKGVQYILDSAWGNEPRIAHSAVNEITEDGANELVTVNAIQSEIPEPTLEPTLEPKIDPSKKRPDLKKLKGLL
jgi:hypothetical protein